MASVSNSYNLRSTPSIAAHFVAIKAAISEFNAKMLEIGVDSVRFSRASYKEAKKIAEDRQPFALPLQPLQDVEVVLEVNS